MEKRLLEFDNIMKENDDIYRCAARLLGLSDSAFWILYAFRVEKEELTLREICNVLYQPKQTVHSALKKETTIPEHSLFFLSQRPPSRAARS